MNAETFEKKETSGFRLSQMLELPDAMSKVVVIGIAVFLILFLGVLPPVLRRYAGDDLRGVPMQIAPGRVTFLQISPTTQGGGSLFNAVSVKFADKAAYYTLPLSSKWCPVLGEAVRVRYRVGRKSGQVHVEEVTPIAPATAPAKPKP